MATNTYQMKDSDRKWLLIDASGLVLGRLATEVANLLRGKNKATYSPNVDGGENIVIINAREVALSKEEKKLQKTYYRHSGYPGGIKSETFEEAIEKHPERVIEKAVLGMLPKNKLAKEQMKRLRVYAGSEHPHTQELTKYEVGK
ncbi:MAG: 50S ribosomal protein L13 [Patescibacteria group bacterium]|nr:50S ribosomal protein L13 [Patescibacteria group bacterium]